MATFRVNLTTTYQGKERLATASVTVEVVKSKPLWYVHHLIVWKDRVGGVILIDFPWNLRFRRTKNPLSPEAIRAGNEAMFREHMGDENYERAIQEAYLMAAPQRKEA